MNPKNLGIVGCRLLAVYIFIMSFQSISMNITRYFKNLEHYKNENSWSIWTPELIQVFILLFVACVLWFSANNIAKRMTAGMGDIQQSRKIDVLALQTAGISCIGLFLILISIPKIASIGAHYDYQKLFEVFDHNPYPTYTEYNFIQVFLEFFFGLILIFFAGRLSNILVWLRTFGLKNKITKAE